MNDKNTKAINSEAPPRLECAGVWGGIRNRDLEIRAGKVIGSLYSAACDGGRGGDIYYFGVCKNDNIMRLAVADVIGHGETVAGVGQFVYESLRSHMCDIESGPILGEINRLASERGLEAMTTAVVVAFNADQDKAYLSYAGHPPVLYKGKADSVWSFIVPSEQNLYPLGLLHGLPLAVDAEASYSHIEMPMVTGDRLFIYTDGITECPNPEGELFGQDRLKTLLDSNANAPLAELKLKVLQALAGHCRKDFSHDDVTLIALQIC